MKRFWIMLFVLVLLVGCGKSSTPVDTTYTSNELKADNTYHEFPTSYMVNRGNNYFDYQSGYECAAFASAYLLRYFGETASGLELFKTLPDKTPDGSGAYPKAIINLFESKGYEANYIVDASIETLKYEISKGNPVIVFIHVEVDAKSVHWTHYVPIVGYDEDYFYFAESLNDKANYKEEGLPYNRRTDIATFKNLWKNVDGLWDYPYYQITKI